MTLLIAIYIFGDNCGKSHDLQKSKVKNQICQSIKKCCLSLSLIMYMFQFNPDIFWGQGELQLQEFQKGPLARLVLLSG